MQDKELEKESGGGVKLYKIVKGDLSGKSHFSSDLNEMRDQTMLICYWTVFQEQEVLIVKDLKWNVFVGFDQHRGDNRLEGHEGLILYCTFIARIIPAKEMGISTEPGEDKSW